MYKLYVRPHLDYGDIIYHRYDPNFSSILMRRLEQVQYTASLAVTGAWRGTSRQRLYEELGWESLYERRWYRRLCHFFKLNLTHSPEYLFSLIPPERKYPMVFGTLMSTHNRKLELIAFPTPIFKIQFMNGINYHLRSKLLNLLLNSSRS